MDATPVHPRPYVLFVSTLQPTKNHVALLRLWRRFLTTMSADEVPELVFAGKVGWLAHDIVAQAENADWFGGKRRLGEGRTMPRWQDFTATLCSSCTAVSLRGLGGCR